MVKERLIAVLTFNDGVLCRTKDFQPDYRYTASFVDTFAIDEIVLLDITRPGEGSRENFLQVLEEFASRCFVPLCAGGGIRSFADAELLFRSGADKVSLNSVLLDSPSVIGELAQSYGSQSIVASIDAKISENGYEVLTHNGTRSTGETPSQWAQRAVSLGVGEILLCAIHLDGSLEGYDYELIRLVSSAVSVPVLALAGAGNWDHFVRGFEEGGASAVCTANIFHFTETAIKSAKKHLAQAGRNVRLW